MIGKLRGKVDAIGESSSDHRRRRRRLRGAGVVANAAQPQSRRRGLADHRYARARGRDPPVRLSSEFERSWFRTLQSIQGVGAKVALAFSDVSPAGPWPTPSRSATGSSRASARRRQEAGATHRAELKDKAPALSIAGLHTSAGSRGIGGRAFLAWQAGGRRSDLRA